MVSNLRPAHAVVKGVLPTIVPWAGGIAAELFEIVLTPPLNKRRDEWSVKFVPLKVAMLVAARCKSW